MTTPERSVDEIVEELFSYISDLVFKKGKNWRIQDCLNVKKKLTQTLKAERQKREEVVEAERDRIEEIIKEDISLFKCVDCGYFYSPNAYDNPAFYADKVADCPDCYKKCWHVNTEQALTQPNNR